MAEISVHLDSHYRFARALNVEIGLINGDRASDAWNPNFIDLRRRKLQAQLMVSCEFRPMGAPLRGSAIRVLLVSAGLLHPKKTDHPAARLHRYLNYGLLTLASILKQNGFPQD
jgi:hypothetical protein